MDETCKSWLANTPSMAHTLTFGVLLGYPGEAICSALCETESDSKSGQVIDANITHADKFGGAQPIYSYLKEVKDSPVLADHQALWSNILNNIYLELEEY